MRLDEKQKAFIGYLLSLTKEGEEDRGALAELRSGLGKEPGQMARVHRHVVPYLPEIHYNQDRWYYLIATLFGLHSKHKDSVDHESKGKKWKEVWTMGRAFRPLRAKSDSMEARFVALLNAHHDDLEDHLRNAVRLLKANEEPLDWFRLFDDLLQWNHPEGLVQLRWARDFYKGDYGSRANVADSDSTIGEEGQHHE